MNFIAQIDKLNIVIDSEDFVKLNLFIFLKIIFRFFYFYNKRFLNQRVPNPLVKLFSLKLLKLIFKNQYFVQLLSVLFDIKIVSNSSKFSKKLFLKRIYRIDS